MSSQDVPNVSVSSPKPSSQLVSAIFGAISFALVRFLIGAFFTLTLAVPGGNSAGMQGVAEMAWAGNVAGGIGAGIVAGILLWRLRQQPPTASNGTFVGFMAAIGSYVAIALGAAIIFGVIGGVNGEKAGGMTGAVVMSLVCGGGSVILTSAVVFPALLAWGACLESIRRRSSSHGTEKRRGEAGGTKRSPIM